MVDSVQGDKKSSALYDQQRRLTLATRRALRSGETLVPKVEGPLAMAGEALRSRPREAGGQDRTSPQPLVPDQNQKPVPPNLTAIILDSPGPSRLARELGPAALEASSDDDGTDNDGIPPHRD